MEDSRIIDLYFARQEDAISETAAKYGKYLNTVAYRILFSFDEAEECVSDTYLKAWQKMPPERPHILKAFLAKITRNEALDRLDYQNAQKRKTEGELVFEEIAEAIPETQGDAADTLAVRQAINAFLASQPKRVRIVFLRRYFYFCSVREIALSLHLSESNVKTILSRARGVLKLHLEKEGITL